MIATTTIFMTWIMMRRPHVIEKDWLASLDDFRKFSNQQWSESRLSAL
jgi:hypothetical protein